MPRVEIKNLEPREPVMVRIVKHGEQVTLERSTPLGPGGTQLVTLGVGDAVLLFDKDRKIA